MTEGTSTLASLVSDLSKKFAEPDWLQKFRESAWEAYANTPVKRLEKSDLTKRSLDVEYTAENDSTKASEQAEALLGKIQDSGAPLVYVRDGSVVDVKLSEDLAKQGVVFTSLHNAMNTHEKLVQQYLGSVVAKDEDKWTALNAALWHGGAFLYVPRNVEVADTFHFVHEDTGVGAGTMPRILVVAEEGSNFNFAEVFVVAGEKASGTVRSHVLEVAAKPNSRVTVITSNQFKKGPTHFSMARAKVQNDASVDWILTDVGDGYTVGVVESILVGTGSQSTTKALGIGYGRQHLDLTTSMVHEAKYTNSDIVMHGAVRQRANSLYRSCTRVVMGASGSGSEQTDRMIMLDGTARADAIPMLLIDEYDVTRCGHAASVGRIDETQIYYLMSRGISRADATKMIIWGHLEPTVESIPSEGVRDLVRGLINRELA